MGDPTLIDLARSQDVMVERVANLKTDLDSKHQQNRNSIHEINNNLHTLTNEIWLLKVKIVGYASGAGVLTGVLLKILDHLWKT